MAHETAAPVGAAPVPRRLDTTRGIIFMLIGFSLFSLTDVLAKMLTDTLHPFQIVWARQLGLFAAVLALLLRHGPSVLYTRHPVLQIGRGVVAVLSAACFIFALVYVPLADAVSVTFVAPLIVTVLGAFILRETVGIRRWAAVGAGLVGTLIVVRPGLGVFHPAIFLVLFAAGCFAARQVISRYLSGADPISTTVAYTGLTATLLMSALVPQIWITPSSWTEYALLITLAAAAALGEVMIMRALDIALAVVLSPLQYSTIIWATFWGFMVFGELPDMWTLVGTSIVVASGLYTLYRETRKV